MSALSLCSSEIPRPSTGVDGGGLDDNATVFDQLLDVCARVGIANLRLFSGVQPDFALAYASDGGSKSFLRAEIH